MRSIFALCSFLSLTLGCLSAAQPDQHDVWSDKADRTERPSASREKAVITIKPLGATFEVSGKVLDWYGSFKNNLHLTHEELDRIARGAGEWDTEYASVCNAVLPFDRCAAHIGEEGWGKDGVAFSDLQFRVYDLKDAPKDILARVKTDGVTDAKDRKQGVPELKEDTDAAWQQARIKFRCHYGDYGATAHVDFRAKRFGDRTIVFVFMYTDYQAQEKSIANLLDSFKPAKK
jgi:hypothetical protein